MEYRVLYLDAVTKEKQMLIMYARDESEPIAIAKQLSKDARYQAVYVVHKVSERTLWRSTDGF